MFNKRNWFTIFLFFSFLSCYAQDCELTVMGYVYDESSSSPLAYVNVYIQETQTGTVTTDDGTFMLEDICPGHYHFIISHIGCEDEKFHFDILSDTTVKIALSHTPISLSTVVISGEKESYDNQANLSVKRKVIEDNSNQNLSGLLENESGVHLIKNGNSISKPVVHGLYGNRLLILNNGIAQSGQQWGNDHSPEIDPFASDQLTVVKGASAIEYGGGNLGGVILAEPKRIEREPHLHGQVNYIFETNGRGHTVNTRLQKYSSLLAWRLTGTFKKYGDRRAPDYFLNNTGVEEANFALQLEKTLNEKLFLDLHASTFNTRLGILRGSQIGNLTDLESALTNEVPFFTEPDFSYEVEAPSQQVSHHFVKSKAKYFISQYKILELVLAGQLNNRKEYDIRRSGRTDIPSLSLAQYTFNSELKYTQIFSEDWKFIIGNQNIFTDNDNIPETGILPLIPDYISWKSGLFSTLTTSKNSASYTLGLRYDFEYQKVLAISNTVPRKILRFENQFHNISGLFSLKTKVANTQSLGWNLGYAMRNPAINELYSNGLHQGVSGIEEGDANLETEKALKNTVEYKWVPSSDFAFNVLVYHQYFKDYIFLDPQEETRLTIRGAFPVFKYEQTDANLYGFDVSTQVTISNSVLGLVKYSFLRGEDVGNNTPLIFMAPNSLFGSLTYRALQSIKLSSGLSMEDTEIEITDRLVFEQGHLLLEQDFSPAPATYNLIGLKLSTNLILPSYKIRCFVKADNLLNVRYRDYLNRQRYFADDLGISLVAGINVKF